jgi:hypothetical protein
MSVLELEAAPGETRDAFAGTVDGITYGAFASGAGETEVNWGEPIPGPVTLLRHLHLDEASGESTGEFLGLINGITYGAFNAAAGVGGSVWTPTGTLVLALGDANGVGHSFGRTVNSRQLVLDTAAGETYSSIGTSVDDDLAALSANLAIEIVLTLSGNYVCYPPVGA